MAEGVTGTVAAVVCSAVGWFCPEAPPAPPKDPGAIDQEFYKNIQPPKPQVRVPKPAQLVAPQSLDFGRQLANGKTYTRALRLANGGEETLTLTLLEVSGSEAFGIDHKCEAIQPGRDCVVSVAFNPVRDGNMRGAVLVGAPGGVQRVVLGGTGYLPPAPTKAKPAPKPRVVKARPKPKPVPRPDPAVEATIRSLDAIVGQGPKLFYQPDVASLAPTTLPTLEDQYRMKDPDYGPVGEKGQFKNNISGFPVERCRIIPTETMIPIVLDSPVNSQICGPVLAHIGVDIYGPDGRIRLLKAGTKVEGACDPLEDADASRIPVEFTKITRPDGAVMKLTKAQGADAMGQFGMVGENFDRVFDKYGPSVIASTLAAAVAYGTAPSTNDDGTAVETPLSAAGEAFNQNIAQIVAEELRRATELKRRIRIAKGTLMHLKPTNYWYFPTPTRIVQVDPKDAKLTSVGCEPGALQSTEGRAQNKRR